VTHARPTKTDDKPIEPVALRIPDAVRFTGISRAQLYKFLKAGDIEYVKVGASTLVLTESLRRFVEVRRDRR
jgi:hypothetical protein